MYYGIKNGQIWCKSNKIINLRKGYEFYIELEEKSWHSGDFYDYETKEFSINPDSVNRIDSERENPEKTELELLQEKYEELEARIIELEK